MVLLEGLDPITFAPPLRTLILVEKSPVGKGGPNTQP